MLELIHCHIAKITGGAGVRQSSYSRGCIKNHYEIIGKGTGAALSKCFRDDP